MEDNDYKTQEQTCRAMGLAPAKTQNPEKNAKAMRRFCNGKFGKMSTERWNIRVVGTSGLMR